MILLDYQQVLFANLFKLLDGKPKDSDIEEDILRHMALNTIRAYNKKYKPDYGEMIICCDYHRSWRKDIYPYYKANRKKDRDNSDLNYKKIFDIFSLIRDEIEEYLPYRVIKVERAEADDVISTLIIHSRRSGDDPVLIISTDKDFRQLQKFKNVDQLSPTAKSLIIESDPTAYLIDHIIQGDRSDGIPNIMTRDDIFVTEGRQTTLSKKRFAMLRDLIEKNEIQESQYAKEYERNRMMVDLTLIPEDLQKAIIDKYNEQEGKNRSKIMKYFMEKRLRKMLEFVNDF